MDVEINTITNGTVTTPKGFLAGATYIGIKTYGADKLDLGILFSEHPCSAAGAFTTNKVRSPSVVVSEKNIASGRARAIVANSGCANCCVGEQGYKDALDMSLAAAKRLGIPSEETLVCSTGIIGLELPMALIRAGINKVQLSREGGNPLARAILTTDSRPKEYALSISIGGTEISLGGIAKGSGMIYPNMATMLCFLTTDAAVDSHFLRKAIKEAVNTSFNLLCVDGDTSTNDSVIVLANGAAGGALIREGTREAEAFQSALNHICIFLAKEIARDGEGATKLVEVTVEGAKSLTDARAAARAVVSSTLVKSAIHGSDPNWGRIISAVGQSGAEIDESRIGLHINEVCIMEKGQPVPFFRNSVVATLSGPEVSMRISLNLGDASATAWGCDLSEEYVTFNSAYVT